MEADQKFLEEIVKQLVTHPDDVKTTRKIDELGVLIELSVNAEDMGTVIGKKGNTAQSFRTLLKIFGAKNNAKINLRIIEPEGGETPKKDEDKEIKEEVEEVKVEEPVEEVEEVEVEEKPKKK